MTLVLSDLNLTLDRPLFRGLSCHLKAGRFAVLQGESGVGKSSLLRSMVDLESRAQSTLLWQGKPVSDEGIPEFRTQVAYVPQAPPNWSMSVEESLALAFQFRAQGGSYEAKRAQELCTALRLDTNILGQALPSLSGGQAKRVALVRAILLKPQVLLLDEPASGLDPHSSGAMLALLKDWFEQGEPHGRAVLCSTHQPEWCESLTNESWTLKAGGLLEVRELA